MQGQDLDVTDRLPKERTVARCIDRAKGAMRNYPKAPKDLNFVSLPDQLTVTTRGEWFLMKDSGPGTDRFFIFTTHENLDLMCKYRDWSGDGTFSVTPHQFYQLYTLHEAI